MNIIRVELFESRPDVAGVYIVLSPDKDEVLYIGQSQNINQRFQLHKQNQLIRNDGYWWFNFPMLIIPIDDFSKRIILETSLIGLLNPIDNKEFMCQNRKLCKWRVNLIKSDNFTLPVDDNQSYRLSWVNSGGRKVQSSKPIPGESVKSSQQIKSKDGLFCWVEPDSLHRE